MILGWAGTDEDVRREIEAEYDNILDKIEADMTLPPPRLRQARVVELQAMIKARKANRE